MRPALLLVPIFSLCVARAALAQIASADQNAAGEHQNAAGEHQNAAGEHQNAAGEYGPSPAMPPAHKSLIPTINVAKAVGWPTGMMPRAAKVGANARTKPATPALDAA